MCRPPGVLDKHRGSRASYDFTLGFVNVEIQGWQMSAADGPSLFTALQEQLGLKLELATAPFDVVVIEHVKTILEN